MQNIDYGANNKTLCDTLNIIFVKTNDAWLF